MTREDIQLEKIAYGKHESRETRRKRHIIIPGHQLLGDILACCGDDSLDLIPGFRRLERVFKREEGEDWGGFGYELNAWYQAIKLTKDPEELQALEQIVYKKFRTRNFGNAFYFLEDCPESWNSSFLRELQNSIRREVRRHMA